MTRSSSAASSNPRSGRDGAARRAALRPHTPAARGRALGHGRRRARGIAGLRVRGSPHARQRPRHAALAASSTVANLLPATSFFLMSERYAPARALIDAGACVSLSTDCNPGTSMTENMQLVMQLATLRMKMTVEESLTAATLNGAQSLAHGGRDRIDRGRQARGLRPARRPVVPALGVSLRGEPGARGVAGWEGGVTLSEDGKGCACDDVADEQPRSGDR